MYCKYCTSTCIHKYLLSVFILQCNWTRCTAWCNYKLMLLTCLINKRTGCKLVRKKNRLTPSLNSVHVVCETLPWGVYMQSYQLLIRSFKIEKHMIKKCKSLSCLGVLLNILKHSMCSVIHEELVSQL